MKREIMLNRLFAFSILTAFSNLALFFFVPPDHTIIRAIAIIVFTVLVLELNYLVFFASRASTKTIIAYSAVIAIGAATTVTTIVYLSSL